ncbi:MAG: ATP-binding protein, partial [Myxococcota bacterium]
MSEPTVMRTKVDLSGLMAVLGEHLYSTPTVALRELVQNAHDSCHRRLLESAVSFEPHIEVRGDSTRRTLSIEDNGAGLTREEIEKYLATVGSGYTRTLRDSGNGEDLIGYFGLGFLSAFIVAERTEVHTCSYQSPGQAWMFSSRSGQSYTIGPAESRPVGTRVTLYLSDKFATLADVETLRTVLERYCCLLEFPVHCGGEAVNGQPPPWRDSAERSSLRRRKLALTFAERFEHRFTPLFTMQLATERDGDPCRGLLWVQDGATYGTSDNRNVWVFVRGMMV